MSLQVELLPFQNVCVAISARQWHTVTLLRRCSARSYATYDVVCSTQRESNFCAVARRGRMPPMARKAQAAYPQASGRA